MKVLNIIVAAAASMALMAACSSKTGSAAAEASQNDTVAVAAPAEAVIEVAAGDTALSFSTPLAVIDFNATWCGPCQQFKPVFHKVAAKYADRITFFSVDTDSCPALAVQYQVQSIPQITAISADSVVANQIGSMSEADFTAYIESLLQ